MNDFIKFDYGVEEIKQKINSGIEEFEERIEKISKLKEKRNFENTVRALAVAEGTLYNKCHPIAFLSLVHTEGKIRDAASEGKKEMEKSLIKSKSRVDLFEGLCKLEGEKEEWGKEEKRVYEKLFSDLSRNGLHLREEEREKVSEKRIKIAELSLQYNKNVNEEKQVVKFSEKELEGMPEHFFESLERDEEGRYCLTLKYPHVFPVLQNCRVAETRKRIRQVFESRCSEENVSILKEVLRLREECAHLLGYESDSHFMLETKLAKTPHKVEQFLEEASSKLRPLLELELRELLELKEEETKPHFEGKLNAWDISYYQNKRLKSKFKVDDEVVREFFPFEKVIQGVLSVYSQVLSLTFEEEKEAPVWHPSVTCYSVFDQLTKEYFGKFYLDLFPREGPLSQLSPF